MKKLIFLALMAFALVGFVSAVGVAYPPWGVTLEAALSEYSVDGPAVTPDTVLDLVLPITADPSSLQAVLANDNYIAIRPQNSYVNDFLVDYESRIGPADFYLRL